MNKHVIPRGRLTPLLLAIAAVGLALWGQSLARQPQLLDALLLFAVAVALFCRAATFPDHRPPPADLVDSPDVDEGGKGQTNGFPASPSLSRGEQAKPAASNLPRRYLPVLLVVAGLLLESYSLVTFRRGVPLVSPWLFYLAGASMVLAGLWMLLSSRGDRRSVQVPHKPRHLLVLAFVVLVGAFFRFYNLDAQPAGLFYDEAVWGLDANTVLRGEAYPVYFEANYGHGPLYIYLLAAFINFLGPDAFTLRLLSAMIGTLTVPALYVFVKPLFGPRTALVAAFLLAISRWHANFSRIAFDAIQVPLLELLFFHFLLKALRSGTRRDYLWAGVTASLGLNSYVAFRLVPFIVLLYLLVRTISRRRLERTVLQGVGITLFSCLIVAAPLIGFYLQYPSVANQRLDAVNVLAGKSIDSGVEAVVENTRQHLLMFNRSGDRNGRHNLPGEPMLDDVGAALFVVGLGFCLLRARRHIYAFFLIWFVVMLSAGIMSVEFEAPQALRTIGVIPVVVIFVAIVVDRLLRLSRGRGRVPQQAIAVALIALFGYSAFSNFDNYFVRQARHFASWNAFSTGETIMAREIGALGSGWHFYVTSLFADHPTLRFLAPDAKGYRRIEAHDHLPVHETGDRPVAIFLDPLKSRLFADARRYYPNATFKQFTPPFGGPPGLVEVLLQPEDIRGVQGLSARYYLGNGWSGPPAMERLDPGIAFDWASVPPLPVPFSVEWTGTLTAAEDGIYLLGVRSSPIVAVWLDENLLLEADGHEQRLRLARGNHSLRMRAVVTAATGRTELYWQPPNGSRSTIPAIALYAPPVAQNGLLGNYYRNGDWSGAPALQQIDSSLALYFHNTPLPRPYSVEWYGKVEAKLPGEYRFGLESIDDSWLQIDGQPVVEAHSPNRYEEGRLWLDAGWHDIQVRYVDKSGWSHINLYWTPPGQTRQIIPAEQLLPPRGGYPSAAPPIVTRAPVPAPATAAQMNVEPPTFVLSFDGVSAGVPLNQPKDVAVASDGSIFVADTGNSRVVHFDRQGRLLSQIGSRGPAPGQLIAPLALAIAPDGDLLVLDEEPGYVNRFAPDGRFRGRFGGPTAGFYHPRGLAVGPDGTIYVADTGSARIVAYAPDGTKLREIGGKGNEPGRLLGPVGLAIDVEGMLWVADVDNKRVQRLDTEGRYLGSFAIPPGESVDGAHLALGKSALYLTDPANHGVLIFGFQGDLLGKWGTAGGDTQELRRPVGIALGLGDIWLADRDNNRVLRFGLRHD